VRKIKETPKEQMARHRLEINTMKEIIGGDMDEFIIICDSREDKMPLALVDRDISKETWWTRDLKQIKIFNFEGGAINVCKKIKYSNPRVVTLSYFKNELKK
jgi:hypothetical protein